MPRAPKKKRRAPTFICAYCDEEPKSIRIEEVGDRDALAFTAFCHGMRESLVLEFAEYNPLRDVEVIFFSSRSPKELDH